MFTIKYFKNIIPTHCSLKISSLPEHLGKFRGAEMNMKFPDYQNYYGSILIMCKCEYYKQLTNERVSTLKVWFNGIEEGDGCSGSFKAVQ